MAQLINSDQSQLSGGTTEGTQTPTIAPNYISGGQGRGIGVQSPGAANAPTITSSGASGGGESRPTPVGQQTGTGFTNIARIAQANQGNQLGQTLGSDVGNQVSQVGTGIQNALKNTSQQITGSVPTFNSSDISNYFSNPGAATADQTAKIQGYLGSTYQGPTGLNNNTSLQNQVASAQALGQLAGTPGGQKALLQQFVGGGHQGYGAGAQALDLSLLGATANPGLARAREASQGLQQQLSNAQGTATGQINKASNNVSNLVSGLKGQIGTAASNILNPAQQSEKAAETAETTRAANASTIQNAIQSGDYTTAINTLASSGAINPNDASSLLSLVQGGGPYQLAPGQDMGALLTNALNQSSAQGLGTVNQPTGFLTPSQAASLNALSSLSGQTPSYQSGSYTPGTLSFNSNSILGSLSKTPPASSDQSGQSGQSGSSSATLTTMEPLGGIGTSSSSSTPSFTNILPTYQPPAPAAPAPTSLDLNAPLEQNWDGSIVQNGVTYYPQSDYPGGPTTWTTQ